MRPRSGGKPTGVPPWSGRGSRVATGRRHPRSGRVALGGRNSRRDHSDRGRTEGRRIEAGAGRGRTTPPPTEQPGRRDMTAAKTGRWAGQGRRSRHAHSGARRWTTAAWRTCQGIPLALMAPGPSTARSRSLIKAYWRRRGRRLTKPTRGTPVVRPAMGPQRTRTGRIQRRRETKPCSVRSPRKATTESGTRRGEPPKGNIDIKTLIQQFYPVHNWPFFQSVR